MADIEFDLVPMQPTESDLVRFRDCFVRNGSDKDVPGLSWMFLDNGSGKLLVSFAMNKAETEPGGDLAGIYAVLPVRMRVDGAVVPASQSLDTMTDHRYQKRGLFITLANDCYQRCAAEGLAFVYGFPNGNSAHGFFKRLGWASLDPLPFLIKPLRTRYFLRRFPGVKRIAGLLPDLPLRRERPSRGDFELRPFARFDAATDAVWHAFASRIRVGVECDAAYLNWRFSKPGERYARLGAYNASGTMRGFVVYTSKAKHGGTIGYVMELLYDPAVSEAGRQLLAAALNDFVRARCDAVLAWCFPHSPNADAYRGAGFVPMPERLRPIELHVGARAFDERYAPVLADRGAWYISYADSDTV